MASAIPCDYLREIIGEDKYQEIIEKFAGFTIYVPKLVKSYAEREEMYMQLINKEVPHHEAIKTMSAQLGVSVTRLAENIRDMKKRKSNEKNDAE